MELLALVDGRAAVIVTELQENRGTSITNVAECLASNVCDRFGIEPDKLVWIEHYGYAGAGDTTRQRTFDRVTFTRRPTETMIWSPAVRQSKPDGWPGYFQNASWRPMTDDDWRGLGLPPRSPVTYDL